LATALPKVGLQLNLQKSQLWGPGVQTLPDEIDNIPDHYPLDHPIRHVPVVPYGGTHGVTVLGIPVDSRGEKAHASKKWDAAVANTLTVLSKLRGSPDGQIRHALLSHCLDACKVNHLMRAVPHAAADEAMTLLSDALKLGLCDMVQCGVPHNAWLQATLPVSLGGLGIKDPITVWPQARIAAIVNFASHAHIVGVPDEVREALPPDLPITLDALSAQLGTTHDPTNKWLLDPSSILAAAK
jgi:hypothetical protein